MAHRYFLAILPWLAAAALSLAAGGCGSDSGNKDTSTQKKLDFTADIAPIIKASCAASGCHGKSGAKSKVYEDNETNFTADKTKIKTRMNLDKNADGYMPASPGTISDDDKSQLINFLDQ